MLIPRIIALLRGAGGALDIAPEPSEYRRICRRSHRRDVVGDSFKSAGRALRAGVQRQARGGQQEPRRQR